MPFQHHPTQTQSVSDIFTHNSRPMSGKSISVTRSRPSTPSTVTQLKFIRPQSSKGIKGKGTVMQGYYGERQVSQFSQPKKNSTSFVEDQNRIEGKVLF